MDLSEVILEQVSELISKYVDENGNLLDEKELYKIVDKSISLSAKEMNCTISYFLNEMFIIDSDNDGDIEFKHSDIFDFVVDFYSSNADTDILTDEIIFLASKQLMKTKSLFH